MAQGIKQIAVCLPEILEDANLKVLDSHVNELEKGESTMAL
ncbi:hypothetical protein Xbed_03571 [Xenorhabdus beddingii]|uniref:Uncharacterized protein n=1 Tax=Xenorhabdus beddingii TaxID=40578 RepID=A0A1Y2SAF8_9GAMM|nr:hypothetical protein [Xenorhabdus beddingii]OTA15643.1 hypothetical protein Xbed_03571 [Xenorhabdus beddingii]